MRCTHSTWIALFGTLALAGEALAAEAGADEAWALRALAADRAWVCHADGRVEAVDADEMDAAVPAGIVSADGITSAFVEGGAVYVARADGGEPARVSPRGLVAAQPLWSPDGRQLAFIAREDEQWQVHLVDVDGGRHRRVSDAEHGARLPKFAPDGRLSYLVNHQRQGKLQPMDLVVMGREGEARPVQDVMITDYAWSPDGETIAYGRPGALVFHELATGQEQEIEFPAIDPRLRSHAAINLAWRPDGDAVACSILFFGGRQAGTQIYGDEQVFIIPREGEERVFDVAPMVQRIEWLEPTPK